MQVRFVLGREPEAVTYTSAWERWIGATAPGGSAPVVLPDSATWVRAAALCEAMSTGNADAIAAALWFAHHDRGAAAALGIPEALVSIGLTPPPGGPPGTTLLLYRFVERVLGDATLDPRQVLADVGLKPPWPGRGDELWRHVLGHAAWGERLDRAALLRITQHIAPVWYRTLVQRGDVQTGAQLLE